MKMATKKEIEVIKARFIEKYEGAETELDFNNLYELVIAVMFSAQCTDKRVNIITPAFFKKYPSVVELAKADLEEVKVLLNSCSFFNNKAKNCIAMAKKVMDEYSGEIPLDEKGLMSLAGVGQKTAHVVLIEYTGANYMAVDTHVFRTSHRLGLSKSNTPEKVEDDLVRKYKDNLHTLHQAMVLFGRYICKAVKPDCDNCFLTEYCKSKESFKV
jgi:endonuclease III